MVLFDGKWEGENNKTEEKGNEHCDDRAGEGAGKNEKKEMTEVYSRTEKVQSFVKE